MAEQENPQTENQPKKEERVDELDILGGLLVKFVKGFFTFYRRFFKSQQYD